ncbi:uncharacterized protein PRCAT00005834001 [Priceomyces carsonii]|uniref:uncharacterized protein n=1 Tax=Priceomyces carsonii TaxID=28549 RepID=UPI002ED7EAA6|nr:unnamed protein product [Priceomyces carsonii]
MVLKKVFITGATGYIGGEVLYQVLNNKKYDFEIRALVRTPEKGIILQSKTNDKVIPILGTLDNSEILEKQANECDIIINTADVDHVPSAQVFYDTLVKKSKPTIFIHTSGTSVLGDGLAKDKKPSTKVYSDAKNIDEINSLDSKQPHRPVDEIILSIQENNPTIDTVIVAPSNIVGKSDGYDRIVSIQIPYLVELSVKKGQAFSVYDGKYIWSHIHIKDLGDLYSLLLNKLLQGESVPKGKEGYYFGSYFLSNEEPVSEQPSEVEHYWADVSSAVGEYLFKNNIIETPKIAHLDPTEIRKIASFDFAPSLWGTNSRSRGDNGHKIGWKPKYPKLDDFWKTIPEDIDYMIKTKMITKATL